MNFSNPFKFGVFVPVKKNHLARTLIYIFTKTDLAGVIVMAMVSRNIKRSR